MMLPALRSVGEAGGTACPEEEVVVHIFRGEGGEVYGLRREEVHGLKREEAWQKGGGGEQVPRRRMHP